MKNKKNIIFLSFLSFSFLFLLLGFFIKSNNQEENNETKTISASKTIILEMETNRQAEKETEEKEEEIIFLLPEDKKEETRSNFLANEDSLDYNEEGFLNDEDKSGYRHSDHPGFNSRMMVGFLDESNLEYRSEIYAILDYELAANQMEFPNPDPIDDIVEQFENAIDYALGVDFCPNKRKEIGDSQRDMLREKSFLDDQEYLSDDVYLERLSEIYQRNLKNMAENLNDEQFYLLFQITKEQIPESFSKIFQISE